MMKYNLIIDWMTEDEMRHALKHLAYRRTSVSMDVASKVQATIDDVADFDIKAVESYSRDDVERCLQCGTLRKADGGV